MSRPPFANHIAAATATFAPLTEAENKLTTLRQRQAGLAAELAEHKAGISRLVEAEKRDAASRLLDGEESAPPNARRVGQLNKLRIKAEATEAAIPVIAERIAQAAAEVDTALRHRNEAVLNVTIADKGACVAKVREGLAPLQEPLTRMLAAEFVQQRLVGRKFKIHGNADFAGGLFSGTHVVAAFLTKLPDRFAHPALNLEAMTADAERIADSIIREIKGE